MKNRDVLLFPAALPEDPGGDALRSAIVYASNASRFDSSLAREELTQFAVAYRDPENLDQLLEELFPSVPGARKFSFRRAKNAQEFIADVDDLRAIGAEFKRVEGRGEEVLGQTRNRGLTIALDKDGEGALPNAAQIATERLIRRLLRGALKRGFAALDEAATGSTVVWNSAADPDMDVDDVIDAGGDERGFEGNVVVYGRQAWARRKRAYRGSDKAGAMMASRMTPADVAAELGIDRVIISRTRYATSESAKAKLVGNYVYSYHAERGQSLEDPSNVKRVVTPTDAGKYKVYVEDKPKFIVVTVEHYDEIIIPSSLGIRKITANVAPAA